LLSWKIGYSHSCDAETLLPQQLLELLLLERLKREFFFLLQPSEVTVEEQVLFASVDDAGGNMAGVLQRPSRI